MKFIVDSFPYYGETCPFWMMCSHNASADECPRYWDKEHVCGDENPHECQLLKEQEVKND